MDGSFRVDLPDEPGDHPRAGSRSETQESISQFDAGFLVGVLVGEGHFGGDGRQPQITLRMHTDHASLFQWLMRHFPDSKLYGPYAHSGRRYYQWMARSVVLRQHIVPLLDRHLRPEHSERVWERYQAMKQRYSMGPRDDGRNSTDDGPAEADPGDT